MPSTFTTGLNLEKMATGEQDNTWGDVTNVNWDDADKSIAQTVDVNCAGSLDVTLSETQYLNHTLTLSGVLTGNISVIFPSQEANWWVKNATTGAFTITLKVASQTGFLIPQGRWAKLYHDGTDVAKQLLDPVSDTTFINQVQWYM